MTFETTGLDSGVLSAVAEAGYTEPTPIQARTIPHVMEGRDVLGIAQTGTGKTAAFALPMISRLAHTPRKAMMARALILEPTRELALQVEENFTNYGKNHTLATALLIGGVSFDDQRKKLDRGVDILIATPGRLLDHFGRGRILLSGIRMLVIDEADRMLDMGFIPDIERIVKLTPPRRQTLLFSATFPAPIEKLSASFLRAPEKVEVARSGRMVQGVRQTLIWSAPRDKTRHLAEILRAESVESAIIFCNRKRDIAGVLSALKRAGFSADALHGDMDQINRMKILDKFRQGETPVLVASDVAQRGLDIAGISHVINYDVPRSAEDYVHRAGRTARAGAQGAAFTLATEDDLKYVAQIEALTGTPLPLGKTSAPRPDDTGDAPRAPTNTRAGRAPRAKAPRTKAPRTKAPRAKPPRATKAPPRPEESPEQVAPRASQASGARIVGMGDHVPDFMRR